MAIIDIKLKPRKIEINSGRDDYSGSSYQSIHMSGEPEYDGNAYFSFMKDGQKVKFPREAIVNIEVRDTVEEWWWEREKKILANSWVDENSKFIGFVHHVPARDDSEMPIDRLDLLEMSIYVSENQIARYIDLISSRKSTITASGSFRGWTKDDTLKEGPFGFDVTWDLDKGSSVCKQSLYPNMSGIPFFSVFSISFIIICPPKYFFI